VVSPSTPAGRRSGELFNHYSLLRTTEDLLGLGHLGEAAAATSMSGAFGLTAHRQ
jgi:phosphatidylinositol-3-phosphatase